jgi:hypothetical protein
LIRGFHQRSEGRSEVFRSRYPFQSCHAVAWFNSADLIPEGLRLTKRPVSHGGNGSRAAFRLLRCGTGAIHFRWATAVKQHSTLQHISYQLLLEALLLEALLLEALLLEALLLEASIMMALVYFCVEFYVCCHGTSFYAVNFLKVPSPILESCPASRTKVSTFIAQYAAHWSSFELLQSATRAGARSEDTMPFL